MRERSCGSRRPNILFMIGDDHRFDSIGAYGNPVVQTPALDRLAAEGVLFQSVYTMGGQTAALCVPCRASLLTGANTFRATVSGKEVTLAETENKELWALNPALAAFPELLRRDGYRTCGIGKWHNGEESFARCFTDGAAIFFGGMGDHVGLPVHDYDADGTFPADAARMSDTFSSELFADAAIDFIRSSGSDDDPFMLYVAFTAPHDPRTPPKAYADLYEAGHMPLPINFMDEHPFDNGELRVRDELLAALPRSPDEIRQHLAEYYSMITHMDAQIGRIVQALKDSGHYDDTLIVYTADHGIALGQHGLVGKQNLYEHSVHIPLIMRGAGMPQGVRAEGLASQIDIVPTLCEWTGTALPDAMEGVSLAPLVTGEAVSVRQSVYAAYKSVQRSVSDGRWKLIRYYRCGDGDSGSDYTQLFDLLNDPWELHSLCADPALHPHLQRLEDELRRWQREVQDPLLEDGLASVDNVSSQPERSAVRALPRDA